MRWLLFIGGMIIGNYLWSNTNILTNQNLINFWMKYSMNNFGIYIVCTCKYNYKISYKKQTSSKKLLNFQICLRK